MRIQYYINGKDITEEFGIYVSASSGVLDLPKLKEPDAQDWREYHGKVVDLATPRMQEREITLDCFIKAESQIDFIEKLNAFYIELTTPGFKRLHIDINGANKPLIYDVYAKDGIKINKQWSQGMQIGKFQIKLIEPNPQKMVLKTTLRSITFSIATNSAMTVFWGDGTKKEIGKGTGQVLTYAFKTTGSHYISIAGVVADIAEISIDRNTETIWQKI